MLKKIRLSFPGEQVSCLAVLFEDKAPETSKMIWDSLMQPLEGSVIHAMFTGRELSFSVSQEQLPESALSIPPENQIVLPIPGDIVWNAYKPYEWQGVPNPVYDIGIFYGRDSRILLPAGWRPSNLFAAITENLDSFALMCARCQIEGRKKFRIERA